MIRVYLDNCCYNRPFDEQDSIKIRIETESKIYIQNLIKQRKIELVWSYMLEQENEDNPFEDKKINIQEWAEIAVFDISESEEILITAEEYFKLGFKNKDAIHIACAIHSKANFFITTDKGILKKAFQITGLKIINPIDFLDIEEETF